MQGLRFVGQQKPFVLCCSSSMVVHVFFGPGVVVVNMGGKGRQTLACERWSVAGVRWYSHG